MIKAWRERVERVELQARRLYGSIWYGFGLKMMDGCNNEQDQEVAGQYLSARAWRAGLWRAKDF